MDEEAKAVLIQPAWQIQDDQSDRNSVDQEHALKQQRKPGPRKGLKCVVYSVIGFILFMGAIGFVKYILNSKGVGLSSQPSQPLQWKGCGNTTEEALGKDCIFEFVAMAWVPRACYDQELEEEFLQRRDWHFYADVEGQQELSKEVIRETGGTNPLFMSYEFHWVHCAYTWKKLHRSRLRQKPIDTHISNYYHTIHCADGLADHGPSNDTRPISKFHKYYESCVML
jgi:hypothetical protein